MSGDNRGSNPRMLSKIQGCISCMYIIGNIVGALIGPLEMWHARYRMATIVLGRENQLWFVVAILSALSSQHCC